MAEPLTLRPSADRIRTQIEGRGLLVSKATVAAVAQSEMAIQKQIRQHCLEEYDLENPNSQQLIQLCFDTEEVLTPHKLRQSVLGRDILRFRKANATHRIAGNLLKAMQGERVHWSHVVVSTGRVEARKFNVQIMPRSLRAAVPSVRGTFANVVFPTLEWFILGAALGDIKALDEFAYSGATPEVDEAILEDALCMAAAYDLPQEVYETQLSKAFGEEETRVALVAMNETYPELFSTYERFRGERSIASLFGKPLLLDGVGKNPGEYYMHTSCQEVLDALALRIHLCFEGIGEIVLIDHHSILVDLSTSADFQVFEKTCKLEIGEYSIDPEVQYGATWADVTSGRPSVPCLYGKRGV